MPANEKTWRDMKSVHTVFAVSALAMLVTTVWMLAADHRREWKQVQREFRDIKSRTIEFRMAEEQTEEFAQRERELEAKLLAVQGVGVSPELAEAFKTEVSRRTDETGGETPVFGPLDAVYDEMVAAEDDGSRVQLRNKYFEKLQGDYVNESVREATNTAQDRKFMSAELDADRSRLNIAVGHGADAADIAEWRRKVGVLEGNVETLRIAEEQADTYRKNLESIVKQMKTEEAAAAKNLDDHRGSLAQLEDGLAKVRAGRPGFLDSLPLPDSFGRILERPIVDGFGSPIKIHQLWLPDLKIDYNFSNVARFDRCITCHLAIKETAPGSVAGPGFEHVHPITIELPTPDERPVLAAAEVAVDVNDQIAVEAVAVADTAGSENGGAEVTAEEFAEAAPATLDYADETTVAKLLKDSYGLRLADVADSDGSAMVSVVWDGSVAARAGLQENDVIVQIGDVRTPDRRRAVTYLLDSVEWGAPLSVQVQRGFAHPFSSHPRLDLFVGDTSPHKMQEFGCTICHDGQGSATTFKYASHTPNTSVQREDWQLEHGWFDNHHWIFPMLPDRFAESSCLKCHHEVVDLEPSERFPDPPAPKLVEGFELINRLGCFGCHEINGFDGANRIGPDIRPEPSYALAAADLLIDENLNDEERQLAQTLVKHPEDDAARRLLVEFVNADFKRASAEDEVGESRLTSRSHNLAGVLGDVESPGQLRKTGPSLRHVASKVDANFIYNWIKNPQDFRPSSKMPRFYGLYAHLPEGSSERQKVERFEAVEIHGIAEYLLGESQPFEYLTMPSSVTAEPSAQRGAQLFELRGCLACHQNRDFPAATEAAAGETRPYNKFGPDLSDLGSKLVGDDGQRWLYSWLKQPNRYHARTKMPDLKLEPITAADGSVSDPAADIAAFLLSQADRPLPPAPELDEAALDDLVLEQLRSTFTRRQAERYLQEGIPESLADELKGDEVELVVDANFAKLDDATRKEEIIEKKLMYIGRKTLSRRGCAGCHDIPGFENAKPIGTSLADWGRKDSSKLAFEHIAVFLESTGADRSVTVPDGDAHADEHDSAEDGAGEDAAIGHGGHGMDLESLDTDTRYFVESVLSHKREGFLWQKLRQPRSYDYEMTETKTYLEQLRMPQFNLTDDEIETLMTFVLGLVAEPPAQQYVFQPDAKQLAIIEGRKTLEKFNCGGCHTLEMQRWEISYDSEAMQEYGPGDFADFSFLKPHFTPEQLAASESTDRRGMGHATVHGRPAVTSEGEWIEDEDFDGNPANFFGLWKPAAVAGIPWAVGEADLTISLSAARIDAQHAQRGGFLTRYLYPRVLELGIEVANPSDVWGWLPPPLVGEGAKVQTAWLHDFLLDPFPIRPATLLRMPQFNMTSDEASAIVRYFSAVDNAQYPYEYDGRTTTAHLAAEEALHPNRLDEALNIVIDNNYCVKCHLVGDYTPPGGLQALAPRLDRVHNRLRPDFLRDWIANPKRVLPYTGMPQNFPLDDPEALAQPDAADQPGDAGPPPIQQIYEGTSEEHINAVVDLLLNYDLLMKEKTSIKANVKTPPVEGEPAN